MKKDLLTLTDFDRQNILDLLKVASALKQERGDGIVHDYLRGKTLGLIFKKSSTRTRISFEVGMMELGGHAIYLDADKLQMGRGETIEDSARIFSRYLSALAVRTFDQAEIATLARISDIPVINALTDSFHPCQILADFLTIQEKKGRLDNISLTYVGDGNNMAHSLMLGSAIVGIDFTAVSPEGYLPSDEVTAMAKRLAEKSGAKITVTTDIKTGVTGADVIYTDTWISMGQDAESDLRRKAFAGFCVNKQMVAMAKNSAIVMHCLPAHRGEEISAEVLDGEQSVVFDEAENRLHAQKALLLKLIGSEKDYRAYL